MEGWMKGDSNKIVCKSHLEKVVDKRNLWRLVMVDYTKNYNKFTFKQSEIYHYFAKTITSRIKKK